jgi:hypothetical protein
MPPIIIIAFIIVSIRILYHDEYDYYLGGKYGKATGRREQGVG